MLLSELESNHRRSYLVKPSADLALTGGGRRGDKLANWNMPSDIYTKLAGTPTAACCIIPPQASRSGD
jgi:hypothetical protein